MRFFGLGSVFYLVGIWIFFFLGVKRGNGELFRWYEMVFCFSVFGGVVFIFFFGVSWFVYLAR